MLFSSRRGQRAKRIVSAAFGQPKLRARQGIILETLEQRLLLDGTTVLDAFKNVEAPAGKGLIIPLTATAANGADTLTYQITSSNPNIKIKLHEGNPYLKLT